MSINIPDIIMHVFTYRVSNLKEKILVKSRAPRIQLLPQYNEVINDAADMTPGHLPAIPEEQTRASTSNTTRS